MENAQDIATMKAQIKTLFENQKEQALLIKEIHNTNVNIEKMFVIMEHMQKSIDVTRHDVDELKAKPSKRWEAVIGGAVGALVTGLVAFVMMKFGLR